jgi:hypothetical protein
LENLVETNDINTADVKRLPNALAMFFFTESCPRNLVYGGATTLLNTLSNKISQTFTKGRNGRFAWHSPISALLIIVTPAQQSIFSQFAGFSLG